jgi:hypothetical protein
MFSIQAVTSGPDRHATPKDEIARGQPTKKLHDKRPRKVLPWNSPRDTEFDLDVHRSGAEKHHVSAISTQAQIALLRRLRGSFDIGFLDCQPQANYKGVPDRAIQRARKWGATVQKRGAGRSRRPSDCHPETGDARDGIPMQTWLRRVGTTRSLRRDLRRPCMN